MQRSPAAGSSSEIRERKRNRKKPRRIGIHPSGKIIGNDSQGYIACKPAWMQTSRAFAYSQEIHPGQNFRENPLRCLTTLLQSISRQVAGTWISLKERKSVSGNNSKISIDDRSSVNKVHVPQHGQPREKRAVLTASRDFRLHSISSRLRCNVRCRARWRSRSRLLSFFYTRKLWSDL